MRAGERLGNGDFAMDQPTCTTTRWRKDSVLVLTGSGVLRPGDGRPARSLQRIYAATEAIAPPYAFVDVDDAARE